MKSAGNTPFLKILIIVFEYQQVLSTGFTTLGIAEQVGFLDITHFSRVFKKLEGISANEYRNKKE